MTSGEGVCGSRLTATYTGLIWTSNAHLVLSPRCRVSGVCGFRPDETGEWSMFNYAIFCGGDHCAANDFLLAWLGTRGSEWWEEVEADVTGCGGSVRAGTRELLNLWESVITCGDYYRKVLGYCNRLAWIAWWLSRSTDTVRSTMNPTDLGA